MLAAFFGMRARLPHVQILVPRTPCISQLHASYAICITIFLRNSEPLRRPSAPPWRAIATTSATHFNVKDFLILVPSLEPHNLPKRRSDYLQAL